MYSSSSGYRHGTYTAGMTVLKFVRICRCVRIMAINIIVFRGEYCSLISCAILSFVHSIYGLWFFFFIYNYFFV